MNLALKVWNKNYGEDMDIRKLIQPERLENTDENQKMGNFEFETRDKVFLYSRDDIEKSPKKHLVAATAYANLCGAGIYHDFIKKNKMKYVQKWCRTAHSKTEVDVVNLEGNPKGCRPNIESIVLCPVLRLNLDQFITLQNELNIIKTQAGYHTVTLGLEYPISFVGWGLNKKLEKEFEQGNLKKTGAKYTGFLRYNGSFIKNEEFEYNGEKYVRARHIRSGEDVWLRVEPIPFRIRNWHDLPQSINPKGNGRALFVEVESEEGIMSGLPFFRSSDQNEDAEKIIMWQNSLCRAYLNGYNLHKEIAQGNGNEKFITKQNFDFEGRGFLNEASQHLDMKISQQMQQMSDELGIEDLE